jgi:hypothetical protein
MVVLSKIDLDYCHSASDLGEVQFSCDPKSKLAYSNAAMAWNVAYITDGQASNAGSVGRNHWQPNRHGQNACR